MYCLSFVKSVPHHFVFVTLEADDAAPVAASIRTGLAAGVLQLQDISVPRRTRHHLPQTQIFISHLQTRRCTGGTLPCFCHEVSRGSTLDFHWIHFQRCTFLYKVNFIVIFKRLFCNLNSDKQTRVAVFFIE